MRAVHALVLLLLASGCRLEFDERPYCELKAQMLPYANSDEGADGSAPESAFALCSLDQLTMLANNPADWDKHFKLGGDVDLAGREVIPIGTELQPFTGTFDGGGYRIKNMRIDRPTESYVAMFGYVVGPTRFENVTLQNIDITGDYGVGALVGYSDMGSIEIRNVKVTGRISGNDTVGSVVGGAYADVPDAIILGDIDATVDVSGTGGSIGGIVGYLYRYNEPAMLTRLSVAGTVTGSDYVGGVGGRLFGFVLDQSKSTAFIRAQGSAGGHVGSSAYHYSLIVDSFATGDVECETGLCGGSSGYMEGDYLRSFATGNVTCGASDCGGLSGGVADTVIESYATGNVFAPDGDTIGGLAGYVGAATVDSYATGQVTGRDEVGGLIAQTYQDVVRSYATGIVTGRDMVGGLIGRAYDGSQGPYPIADNFATGTVSGASATNNVGFIGLLQASGYTVGTNYSVAGRCTNTAGTCMGGSTEIDLAAQPSFFFSPSSPALASWDFTTKWQSDGASYPRLRTTPTTTPAPP